MAWHALCTTGELPAGSMKAFRACGTRVVLYHVDEGWFATQAQCTHMYAPLARGDLDGCRVRCPLHRAEFDVRSGAVLEWANFPPGVQLLNVLRSAKALRTYPVRVREDQVEIEVT